MQPGAENRRSRRVRLASEVRVKVPDTAAETVEVKARTRDISSNGAFFYVDRELAPGSPIEMIVMLPEELGHGDRAWVCCRGTVVRVENNAAPGSEDPDSFGIAADFDDVSVLPEI
jgi:c-di-GMP-binding flagellar brake protein YcgR